MSRFLSISTAVPRHALDRSEVIGLLTPYWPQLRHTPPGLEGELGNRWMVAEPASLLRSRSLTQSMEMYSEHATLLGREVVQAALAQAEISAADLDLIVSVSCTGYMVPSLEARLASGLGFRPDVLRLPITELGCSGGASALAFAHRHLLAHPRDHVLVLAVELSSLSFHPDDPSRDNLTASMVFGDGAGAAILTGGIGGLTIVGTGSHLIPQSTGMLGFDLRDNGFHVVLDRRLPDAIARELPAVIEAFRRRTGLGPLDFVAAHGGGPRILDAVESALGVGGEVTAAARRAYSRVGNVSSASILFALEELLGGIGERPAEGLGLAMGPGVSLELLHLRYGPPD